MSSPLPRFTAVVVALASVAAVATAQVPDVVARHCGDCHRGAEAERGFDLELLFAGGEAAQRAERAAAAVQRVRTHTMPPPDEPAPDTVAHGDLLRAFAALVPDPPGARVATVRRLSRRQYVASVRAVFGLTWNGAERLPEDVRAYGFDTIGDVAGIAPAAFELYYAAAGGIAAAVVAEAALRERAFPPGRSVDQVLPDLLARAFRRPPWPEELDERAALYAQVVADGGSVAAAQAAVLQSVLASPSFLLRAEHGDAAAPARLSAHELAGRLSFLLTSAPPDDALRAQADAGTLHEPAVLAAAALRLATGDGGRALADDFAAQWLHSRDVLTANADYRRYPQIWDHQLRPAFVEQVAQLVMAIVREDHSVLELLDSGSTFVNEKLAKHYGLLGIVGDHFRRVALPDRRRGGLLGTGAVALATSYPLRTSPVLRGRWILDVLLDAAPPPPPPNVGTLPPDDAPVADASLRAQLERHRRDRSCASCHAHMDALGFALENFDVLGRWRDTLHEQPIDARGELPDGTRLDGPVALRDALLARKDEFVRALLARLLTFAIGRPMVVADEPELARLVAATAAGGYRFSALLTALVTSPLFTMRDPGAR